MTAQFLFDHVACDLSSGWGAVRHPGPGAQQVLEPPTTW